MDSTMPPPLLVQPQLVAFPPANNLLVSQQLQWASQNGWLQTALDNNDESGLPPLSRSSSLNSISSSTTEPSSRDTSPRNSLSAPAGQPLHALDQAMAKLQIQPPQSPPVFVRHLASPIPQIANAPDLVRQHSVPQARNARAPRQRKEHTAHCVFVFHIPLAMTDDELHALFVPFGEVAEAVIRRDTRGKSKGFAFVNYFSGEHAERAIKCMKGHPVGGKFLHCALKTKGPGQNSRFPGQNRKNFPNRQQQQQQPHQHAHHQQQFQQPPPQMHHHHHHPHHHQQPQPHQQVLLAGQAPPSPFQNLALIQQHILLQQQMMAAQGGAGFWNHPMMTTAQHR